MARTVLQAANGFTYNKTDVAGQLVARRKACHDSLAWLDIDGDGMIDFVAIESQGGRPEDDDHELVAVHGGTGDVLWRALNGEVSDAVAACDGVVVCATDDRKRVRGLDARTGQQLWAISPPDRVSAGPFKHRGEGEGPTRSIMPRGPFALFECRDGTVHVVEAKTGRVAYWSPGTFDWYPLELPGLVCVLAPERPLSLEAMPEEHIDLYDALRGRMVYRDGITPYPPVFAQGPGVLAIVYSSYPPGAVGSRIINKIVFLDPRTYEVKGQAFVPWKGEFGKEDWLMAAMLKRGKAAAVLPGYRILVGAQGGQLLVLSMQGGPVQHVIPPPQPGLEFRGLSMASNVLVVAYVKTQGTKKVILVGYDPATLQVRWGITEGLGGTELENVLFTTWTTVLAPSARREDGNYGPSNPTAWWHIDPTTGQKVTEYPVPELDCVEMNGQWLCGFVSSGGEGHPIAYDIERRERVL